MSAAPAPAPAPAPVPVPASAAERVACRVQVTGVVQGVGFRPFVYRLARRHRLDGWVRNAAGDVQIEVEGAPDAVGAFLRALPAEAPPLARIAGVTSRPHDPEGRTGFDIEASEDAPAESPLSPPVPPDVAICAECEAELFDPANRRFGYPFITCTACGPRFTLIEAMPYDRERTSMRRFPMCPACRTEYETPADRRYHSETNACPDCGPRVALWRSGHRRLEGPDAMIAAGALLREGGILALRGLGGFHLAADATREDVVARLRRRKGREAKPFAVMVRTLEEARALAALTPEEDALLASSERPIVLVTPRPGARLAVGVAPGLAQVGLMLAYTPLHHLLVAQAGRPLVMTSGNRSEEPMLTANAGAMASLDHVADAFLLHDREIVARADDSVLRVAGGTPVFLRRARGYAPLALPLPVPSPRPLVALGAHFKNTFTLVQGGQAFVGPHVGDLDSFDTLEALDGALAHARRLLRVEPEVAACDRHPDYLSSRLARELGLDRVVAVQHHHAHVAAVMAEHGVTEPVVGIAFDGTGLGDDGRVWGAEILVADLRGYRRAGHLRYAPLPGGDAAARAPWRSALGYRSLEPRTGAAFALAFRDVEPRERMVAERQVAQELNTPLASSMGRLFDAAAAVIGLRGVSRYEGQAAMELEALAGRRPAAEYPVGLVREDGVWVMDPLPLLVALGERRQRGADPADLAADFHATVAGATALVVHRISDESGCRTVALGGGVFQNARLLASLRDRLVDLGLRVLLPRALSPNDGAISYGQAAVVSALLRDDEPED